MDEENEQYVDDNTFIDDEGIDPYADTEDRDVAALMQASEDCKYDETCEWGDLY